MRRFLFLLALAPAAAHAADFSVRPTPAWVEPAAVDLRVDVPRSHVRYGVYAILVDHQVRGTTDYHRTVRKILSASGVQNASELSFDFDPSFQRLVFHDVSVLRDGKRVSGLDPGAVRVIEKEDESEDRIYDGERTALVFLNDVRPGDVIDYSWSLEGANPLLGGKYDDQYDLTSSIPARLIRHRLYFPSSRPLHYRSSLPGIEPRIESRGGERVLTWERANVAAIDVEDETPDWFDPWDNVQVTEYGSWNEVARWSDAMFHLDAASAAAVKKLAEAIRGEHASQSERVVAAIRFVQDDIRYLGIEMGRNSHVPHQPSAVLEQRWGDCKDKALLLSAVLRELGVEAYPALVNTRLRRKLDDRLPSPFLFDHVITEVSANGRMYWIDATIGEQGGTLETIETPNDERALIVRADTEGLAKVVTNEKGSTSIARTYSARDFAGPAELVIRSTYSGGDADAMRATVADLSIDDMAKDRLNKLAADHPKIEAKGLPQIHDDRDRNVLVITEKYSVRDLWARGECSFEPHEIEDHLHRPDTMIRTMPLAFDSPLNVTETVTFRLPEAVEIESDDDVTETPTFRYEHRVKNEGTTVTLTHVLRSRRDAVPAGEVADHLTKINEVLDGNGDTLTRKQPLLASATARNSGGMATLIVLIFAALASYRRRRSANG